MKWEYKIESGLTEAQLNKLGREGWELVGFTSTTEGHCRFAFKRAL